MEQSKYYTPTIEEFHVGFEYESFETCFTYEIKPITNNLDNSFSAKVVSEPKKEDVWIKKVFSFQDMISLDYSREELIPDIKLNFDGSKTRVKYLDKQDIESLGWIYTGKSIDIWFKKEGIFNAISGGHKFNEYKLHYGLHDNCLYINAYFGGQDEGRLFEGIIKNKSELKRLMKQLGIYE